MPTKTIDEMTDEELGDLMYSKPRELINRIRADERAAFDRSRFWDQFDSKFPNLKPDRSLVLGVLQQNIVRLGNVPVDDAIEQLADLAQKEIDATQRRWSRQREYGVMRGGPGIPPDQVNMAPPGEVSLSSLIKERRNARRENSNLSYPKMTADA